jgi:hypothetical protein
MSARRPPPTKLVVIRCGWGSCRYRLGDVYPIRPRLEGDPMGMVVTVIKNEVRRIESLVAADYSGNVTIATCPHDHNAERRRIMMPSDVTVVGSWNPTRPLACAELKSPIERARITGRTQVLRVK